MDKNLVNLTPQVLAKLPPGIDGPDINNDGKPPFQELTFKRKKLLDSAANTYKIYKDHKEFVIAEGESAAKALEASGVQNPYKIIRTVNESTSIIDGSLLMDG